MLKNGWKITFSIGVVTCENPPQKADDLIKMGYDLMYIAKNNRKDSIQYSTYIGQNNAK